MAELRAKGYEITRERGGRYFLNGLEVSYDDLVNTMLAGGLIKRGGQGQGYCVVCRFTYLVETVVCVLCGKRVRKFRNRYEPRWIDVDME